METGAAGYSPVTASASATDTASASHASECSFGNAAE